MGRLYRQTTVIINNNYEPSETEPPSCVRCSAWFGPVLGRQSNHN